MPNIPQLTAVTALFFTLAFYGSGLPAQGLTKFAESVTKSVEKVAEDVSESVEKAVGEDDPQAAAHEGAADAPGPEHQALAACAGEYDAAIKFRPTPEAPWMEGTGTATMELIYDGRFLKQTFEGAIADRPFAGTGYFGYDLAKGRYTSFWIESSSTVMFTSEGKFVEVAGTRQLEFLGNYQDPATRRVKRTKMVIAIGDDGGVTLQLHETAASGAYFLCLEIAYTRR